MSLHADHLVDRRRLKRQLTVWRVVAILAVLAAAVAALAPLSEFATGDHVARLAVEGIIVEDREREQLLADLAAADRVKAVIIHINSPGGTVVGGESLYRALRLLAKDKPVVVTMGTTATSAGYMVALGGDRIVARDGTLTGSIGVILQTTDVTGLLAKIGVTAEAIKSAPLKAVPSPLEPLTDAGRRAAREVVRAMFDLFVDMVSERRGMDRADTLALADGRVFTGQQAFAAGLVDALGGETEALEWLRSEHGLDPDLPVRAVDADEDSGSLRRMISAVAGKAFSSERLTLDGLVSLWQPSVQ